VARSITPLLRMLAGSSAFSESAAPDAALNAVDPLVVDDDCPELLEELHAASVSTTTALEMHPSAR